MTTNNTLREQIILKLLDKTLGYTEIFDINDVRIARIHSIADKLSTPLVNNSIPESDIPLNTPIEAIGLPAISLNSLRHRGINTIADLLTLTRNEILRTRGLGGLSKDRIDKFFKKHNLKYADQV